MLPCIRCPLLHVEGRGGELRDASFDSVSYDSANISRGGGWEFPGSAYSEDDLS